MKEYPKWDKSHAINKGRESNVEGVNDGDAT
jgi:hypothetical protein